MQSCSTIDWTAVGAIATAVAAIVALFGYAFLEWQRRDGIKLSRRAAAHMIGVRTAKLLNSFVDFQLHLERYPKVQWKDSKSLLPPVHPLIGATSDPLVMLDKDEMALLIEMKEADFLQQLMLIGARLGSVVNSMSEYARRYDQLYSMTPPPISMKETVGTHALSEEEILRLRPYSILLFELIESITQMVNENVILMKELAAQYHPMMKRRFPKEKFISLIPPP